MVPESAAREAGFSAYPAAMSPVVVCGRPQNLARARELAAALGGEAVVRALATTALGRPWIVTVPPTEIALTAVGGRRCSTRTPAPSA